MTIAINIGLMASPEYTAPYRIAESYVRAKLDAIGFSILFSRTEQSATEPTFVARIKDRTPFSSLSLHHRFNALAKVLKQDCIAVQIGEIGALIGPNAYKWGEFNEEFFIAP